MTTRKTCTKCKQDKELTEFYREKHGLYGVKSKCKECLKSSQSDYRSNNKDSVRLSRARYSARNRDKINAWCSTKRAADPTFRWVRNTRCNLSHILHGRAYHQPTLDLLGCTRQEYRDHLESKFTDGMSWDNYGEWHVDHILPVSSFDQSDPEQQKICWHFSNTQPLWAEDNMAKGSKLPTESTNE